MLCFQCNKNTSNLKYYPIFISTLLTGFFFVAFYILNTSLALECHSSSIWFIAMYNDNYHGAYTMYILCIFTMILLCLHIHWYIMVLWECFNDTMLFFTCPIVLLCLLDMYYGITVLFLTVY